MEKTLLVKTRKGGILEAELLTKAAPVTCAEVIRHLPSEGHLEHAMFCGEVFFSFVDFRVSEVENAHVFGLQPGDIVFSTHAHTLSFRDGRPVPCEILLVYGSKTVFWDWGGLAPVNLFARVKPEHLPLMADIARRIREEGIEEVTFEIRDTGQD